MDTPSTGNDGGTPATGNDGGTTTTTTATGPVGSIAVSAREFDLLGAVGSGYQEHSKVTFQVLTPDGKPYGAGLAVAFSHEPQGGSYVGAAASCAGGLCTATGATDESGLVSVVLSSGRSLAILSVKAEATVAGVTKSLVAGGFAVVGAKPNGAHISLDCRPYNVPALTVHDCLYSHYTGKASKVDCTLEMADRNGVVIGVPTTVGFQSEAGAVSPSALSPSYDPTKPLTDQHALGQAVGYLDVSGSPLPVDVAPFLGEASAQVDDGFCGSKVANPRDGLVTVIALVDGEEGYVDVNHNGQYDEGEPFVDIGEPFVDANDNGKWDPGEWFLDVNGDGAYTGPNGKWDANTVLWTQTRVTYTGYPQFGADASANELFSRFFVAGAPPAATAPAPDFLVNADPPGTTAYGLFWTDENLNPLSSFTTYDVATVTGNVSAALVGPDFTADGLGSSFRLLYCNDPTNPTACSAGPVEDACKTSPCYVVPDIGGCTAGVCSGFVYGNRGTAVITSSKLGADVVLASATVEGVKSTMALAGESALVDTGGVVVVEPPLGSIVLLDRGFAVLGASGSGYHEQTTVTFQLVTSEGKPYPAGLPVTFTHESQGGSFLGATNNCTAAASTVSPLICTGSGVTDEAGRASIVLSSGRTFAMLAIKADATGGGVSRSLVVGGFGVVGAKPNGAHISLDCRPYNIPALTSTDCLYSHYSGAEGTVDCTLKMADRNGVVIGVPTLVGFQSEAGAVSPSATSPAFDLSQPVSAQQSLGHAVGFLEVYGSPLPMDVAPLVGEFSLQVDDGFCGPKTVNPRDGLVTVIAMVQGEEGYVDLNNNGKYDDGEPFVDIGEPFVDANDNGQWDPGEWFLDLNGDGVYTGPNGKWDGNTVLWTQTRVLYTGYPVSGVDATGNIFSRIFVNTAIGTPNGPPPAGTPAALPFAVHGGPPSTTQIYSYFWTDQNLNPLAASAKYSATSVAGNVTVGIGAGPSPTVDSLGTTFRLLYCDKPTAPTSCFAGPPADACRSAPCFVVPDVGLCANGVCSFEYGSTGAMSITGVQDRSGDDIAQVSATIEGVTTTMGIGGTCLAP